MAYYLDTNIIISAITTDDHSIAVLKWLKETTGTFVVGTFTTIEVAAVLGRLRRTKVLTETDARYAQQTFDDWLRLDIGLSQTSKTDLDVAERFARDHDAKLSAPDAVHLAQVQRLDAKLVTFDSRLADAARRYAVSVVIPE